jgi:hypothetical protein
VYEKSFPKCRKTGHIVNQLFSLSITASTRPLRLRPHRPSSLQRRRSLGTGSPGQDGDPSRRAPHQNPRLTASLGRKRPRRAQDLAQSYAGRLFCARGSAGVHRWVRRGVGGCREGCWALRVRYEAENRRRGNFGGCGEVCCVLNGGHEWRQWRWGGVGIGVMIDEVFSKSSPPRNASI